MPRASSYYPPRIGDQIIWLGNFRNKIGAYLANLGYTAGDITAIVADCDRLIWLLDTFQGAAQSFAQATTAHIRLMRDTPGAALVDPPVFALPAVPAPPANVLPGALKRLLAFIKNLKTRPGYTTAIGEDLGVIGAEEPDADPATTKPLIKAVLATGGLVEIQWKKLGFTSVRIEVYRGTGWQFLAVDTEPHYLDTVTPAPGAVAVWKYRAIYLDGDDLFGQWSDTAEVTVRG